MVVVAAVAVAVAAAAAAVVVVTAAAAQARREEVVVVVDFRSGSTVKYFVSGHIRGHISRPQLGNVRFVVLHPLQKPIPPPAVLSLSAS